MRFVFLLSFRFNKTENLTVDHLMNFDFLLIEANSEEDHRLLPFLSKNFEILSFVRGFNGFYLDHRMIPQMRSIPKIYILEKSNT